MQALRPDPKPTPSLGPCTRSFSVDIPGQALRRTLLRGLAEGTVQWGRRLQAYEEDADGVTLRFAGGDEARAAVLVGCDGIWSAILHPLTPPLPSLSLPSLSHHPTPPHPPHPTHIKGLTLAPSPRSTVRKQRLEGAECPPRYMGVVVVLGRAPCDHPLAREQVRV